MADEMPGSSIEVQPDPESTPTDSQAADPHDEGGWHHGHPFAYEEGLFDYVKFPRSWLADHGIDMHLSMQVIGQFIVEGGFEEEEEGTVSYDLQIYADSSKLGLWKGGYALLRAEGKSDKPGVNPFTGALVPVNFDAMVPMPWGTGIEATEWWVAQEFFEGKAEALFGMWDIGRFFDTVPFSGPYPYRFLNAHMFFNSVLIAGGYAPYNVLGGIITLKPAKWLTVRTGIGDPHSTAHDVNFWDEDEIELLHEWQFKARPFGRPGLFTAGVAYRNLDQGVPRDNYWAVYLNFNQWLYQNPDDPEQAIGLFGRIGITDGDVNPVKQHFSLGVSFDGMIPFRPKDVIGIVGWYNNLSDDLLPGTFEESSSGIEAYYRVQVFPWLQISPDIQYLIGTALPGSSDDTVVLGLRGLFLF
jgi:porin